MTATPHTSRKEWTAVAAIALASFVLITSEFLPVGFLQRLAVAFHSATGRAGLMVTIPGLIAAVAAPLSAVSAGQMDRRKVLASAMALVVLSNVLVSIASSLLVALIGRIFLGVAVGIFWSFCIAVARRLVRDHHGHRATALVLAGVSVGTVVGVPVGSMLAAMIGWRFAFQSVAVLASLSLLALLILLPSIPGEDRASFSSFKALLLNRPLLVGYVTVALSSAGHFAAYTYVQPLLIQHAHFGSAGVGWCLFAYGAAGAVGTFAGERLASLHLERSFLLVALGLTASIGVSAIAANATVIVLLLILWGAGFGALPVCTQLWVFRASPRHFETASAMTMTVFQTSLAIGSLGGGAVFDHQGLAAAFMLGASLLFLCTAVIAFARQLQGSGSVACTSE